MALTPFRWIAAVIIGMLVMSMAIMTDPRDFNRYTRTAEEIEEIKLQNASGRAGERAYAFARQFRIAELSDSLRPLAARGEPRAIRLLYGANVGQLFRTPIDTIVMKGAERVGSSVKMGVDVVAILDTSAVRGYSNLQSGVRPFYILPQNATQRCIVVLPIGKGFRADPAAVQRRINTEDGQNQVLGPCAYYAAFGMPGARVREWLTGRGGVLSYGGSWTRVADQPTLPVNRADPYFSPRPYYGAGHAALEYMSYRGLRCVVGELDACEASVTELPMAHPYERARHIAVGQAFSPGRQLGPLGYYDGGDFTSRETEMLAGMVRSLGRERFATFWASNEPLPAAFAKASGVSLGAWVSDWAKERLDPLKRGPTIPGLTLLWAGLVVIASVLGGLLAAMRREYS